MIALTEKQRDTFIQIIAENSIIEVVKDGDLIWSCNGFETNYATKNNIYGQFGDVNIDRILNEILTVLGQD